MKEEHKCLRCGSVELVEGGVLSTGKAYFKPSNVKFSITQTSAVAMNGMMCLECGNIELVGDVKKARLLFQNV